MSPNMIKATKTLLVMVPLAIGVMAFQNCAPAKFQADAASSKGEASFVDGVGVPDITATHIDDGDDILVVQTPDLLLPTSGTNLALNCKALREKFSNDHVLPANMKDLRTTGQSVAGPYYVHSVSSAESVGGSDLYIVGDNSEALVGSVSVKGNARIVLCGLNAQIAHTVGNSILDFIGGHILEGSKSVGQSKINLYTIDGVAR